jgi:hypothetical protein
VYFQTRQIQFIRDKLCLDCKSKNYQRIVISNKNCCSALINLPYTESFTDVDQGRKMIIFEYIMNTFEASSIFEAAREGAKIGFSLKSNDHQQIYLAHTKQTHCSNIKWRYCTLS